MWCMLTPGEPKPAPKPTQPNWLRDACPRYEGWGCFLSTVILGLIGICLLIGFGGPWYHDCGHNDCTKQQSYGLYCDDYCWHDHSGPGNGVVVLCVCGIFIALAVPYCWGSSGRLPRRIYQEGYTYEIVENRINY